MNGATRPHHAAESEKGRGALNLDSGVGVLDVADDHLVPAPYKLVRVRETHAACAAGDDHADGLHVRETNSSRAVSL